ncbi:MAG: peptidoglycan recognition protein family protein [Candidatus Anammoxibacter sp.]
MSISINLKLTKALEIKFTTMNIRDKHIKLIAVAMGVIAISIFSVIPFLEKSKTGSNQKPKAMHELCSVDKVEIDWEYVVLHHSATQEGNAADFDFYHKNKKKWKYGLAYHFVIGNGSHSGDGEIEVGSRWTNQIHGAHTGKMVFNKVAIGICLVGNFEKQRGPSEFQLKSLLPLVKYLCEKYEIPVDKVLGHNQIMQNHTSCPGKHFPLDEFKMKLTKQLNN